MIKPSLAAVLLCSLIVTRTAVAEETVDQKNQQFSQDAAMVKVGDTLGFTNSDPFAHDLSVKNPDGSRMMSSMEKPGDHVAVTFDKAGQYKVQCLIHPKMKMTVTAQ